MENGRSSATRRSSRRTRISATMCCSTNSSTATPAAVSAPRTRPAGPLSSRVCCALIPRRRRLGRRRQRPWQRPRWPTTDACQRSRRDDRRKEFGKTRSCRPAPEGQATYAMANLRPERTGLPLPKLRKADLPGPYNSVFLLFSNIHTHPNSVIGEGESAAVFVTLPVDDCRINERISEAALGMLVPGP